MADFTCKIDEGYRSACEDLSEYQDTGYCVLHFPGDHKVADFEEARESKLAHKHYDFGGSIFPRVLQISSATHSKLTPALRGRSSVEKGPFEKPISTDWQISASLSSGPRRTSSGPSSVENARFSTTPDFAGR